MNLEVVSFGDVAQIRMSTRIGRAIGYDVSAFACRGILIDLGFPLVSREFMIYVLRNRPAGALITHHHEDHAGNADSIARAGIPIGASRATFAMLAAPRHLELHRRIVWGTPRPLAVPDAPFESEDLRLVPTPGHAPDHHIVWDAERETVFGGDLFLGVKVRAAHHDARPRELVRSLRATAALRPHRFFDAHRGPVRHPVSALGAKADWLEDVIGAIERRIVQGWSDRAIARDVLGREALSYYLSHGAMSRITFVRQVRAESARA